MKIIAWFGWLFRRVFQCPFGIHWKSKDGNKGWDICAAFDCEDCGYHSDAIEFPPCPPYKPALTEGKMKGGNGFVKKQSMNSDQPIASPPAGRPAKEES